MSDGGFLLDFPAGDPEARAASLAEWVGQTSSEFGAADLLEPLDPHGDLSAEERSKWEDLISGLDCSFSLNVDRDVARRLRRHLADQNGAYVGFRDAFADPNGPRGQALLAALADGDYSTIANGGW